MNNSKSAVDPLVCPLCAGGNGCLNRGEADKDNTCWCKDPAIHFPEDLLARIPSEARGWACICKACAVGHQAKQGVQTYMP